MFKSQQKIRRTKDYSSGFRSRKTDGWGKIMTIPNYLYLWEIIFTHFLNPKTKK